MATSNIRDHRSETSRPRVQDHRDEGRPIVRDHRTPPVVSRPPVERPPVAYEPRSSVTVRDHRHEAATAARAEFDGIWSNSGMSLEDKVMMLLFKVMQSMDKQILDKADNIKKLQANQGGSSAGPNKAIDEQTLQLQQLQNSRNNVFSMLAAIVHKFDESTGKVLQKLGQ